MKLTLNRIFSNDDYTIGKLYIDNKYTCDTLEDSDRGLNSDMTPFEQIETIKIKGKTAIPMGIYKIIMNVVSPKFSQYKYYKEYCSGMLPRLLNIKGFDGILIHGCYSKINGWCNCTNQFTDGCILVGYNKIKGKLINSQEAFEKLYSRLKNEEEITIEITNKK